MFGDMGEKFALALLNGLGIHPDKFKADLAVVMGEFHGIKHDRAEFKIASAKVIAEFRATLRRMEATQAEHAALIETLLIALQELRKAGALTIDETKLAALTDTPARPRVNGRQ